MQGYDIHSLSFLSSKRSFVCWASGITKIRDWTKQTVCAAACYQFMGLLSALKDRKAGLT